jgi:hypothetical protein
MEAFKFLIVYIIICWGISLLLFSNSKIMVKVPRFKKRVVQSFLVGGIYGGIFLVLCVIYDTINEIL